MKLTGRRALIFLLILALILMMGLIFWPFVLSEILTPISLTVWLFLRIFVLSVDQVFFWGASILGAFVLLFYRLLKDSRLMEDEPESGENPGGFRDIEFWRSVFTFYVADKREQYMVKRDLIRLLVSTYASKQGVAANYLVMESLKNGEIPLPETIYSFLFLDDDRGQPGKRSIQQILKAIWLAPRHWMDERPQRKIAESYRMIEEVLNYLETSLEIKNDDGRIKPNPD